MKKVVRSIVVVDSHGVELTLYEYQEFERQRIIGPLFRAVEMRSWLLDTGELVERDQQGFVISKTGERLTMADR